MVLKKFNDFKGISGILIVRYDPIDLTVSILAKEYFFNISIIIALLCPNQDFAFCIQRS